MSQLGSLCCILIVCIHHIRLLGTIVEDSIKQSTTVGSLVRNS